MRRPTAQAMLAGINNIELSGFAECKGIHTDPPGCLVNKLQCQFHVVFGPLGNTDIVSTRFIGLNLQ